MFVWMQCIHGLDPRWSRHGVPLGHAARVVDSTTHIHGQYIVVDGGRLKDDGCRAGGGCEQVSHHIC